MTGHADTSRIKLLLWGAVAWLMVCGLVLLQIAPHFPTTVLQWALLLVLGPPLYVLGEALGSWLFSPERGHRISPKSFSLLRLVYGLVVVLLIVGVGGVVASIIKGGA